MTAAQAQQLQQQLQHQFASLFARAPESALGRAPVEIDEEEQEQAQEQDEHERQRPQSAAFPFAAQMSDQGIDDDMLQKLESAAASARALHSGSGKSAAASAASD